MEEKNVTENVNKDANDENISKISEIKARISAEIENVDQNISEISKEKEQTIEEIETKKKELREMTEEEMCKEKEDTLKEMEITEREIQDRKMSITLLDDTIARLDRQIAQIQAEHDKVISELELKKRKLNQQLEYYDDLNKKLVKLLNLLQVETKDHEERLNTLLRQRSEILKRTDLSETALQKMLQDLDGQIDRLNIEHTIIMDKINTKISDTEMGEELMEKEIAAALDAGHGEEILLTEQQIQELQDFELRLQQKLLHGMTNEERLALLRKGLQITPSGRIITKDDRIITLREARLLGLLEYLDVYGEEEEYEMMKEKSMEKIDMKGLFYAASTPSQISSSKSSVESTISSQDIEYLKRVFGKSLSLALAEITAVQPSDPIHYLAHWFIKYRYNQEIDEVKRMELQELMIERERLEAERWHAELEEEARLAVLEALFRAENIIIQLDFERMEMLEEMEGEYEEMENPLNMIM